MRKRDPRLEKIEVAWAPWTPETRARADEALSDLLDEVREKAARSLAPTKQEGEA